MKQRTRRRDDNILRFGIFSNFRHDKRLTDAKVARLIREAGKQCGKMARFWCRKERYAN